jgi:hypothetical protein
MNNRLMDYFQQPERRPPEGDYFEVLARQDSFFYVTRAVAESLLRELAVERPRRWIRFRDLTGASVCVRSHLIEHVRERTAAQRESEREFWRARRQEAKEDRRPWEDDG